MPRTNIEQSRTVFDHVRCRSVFYFCHRIPKPTGLGMVSYSYLNFQLLQTVANGFNLLQSVDSA